jgi:predicted metal-dependent hydrolase
MVVLLPAGALRALASVHSNKHAEVYQQAVSRLNQAEELVEDDPKEALDLAKESRVLFNSLQKEQAGELEKRDLSVQDMEKEAFNNKLADEMYAKGQQLEKSAAEKLAKSQEAAQQGDQQQAKKSDAESLEDLRLSLIMYVKSQIASLRNQQLIWNSLKK